MLKPQKMINKIKNFKLALELGLRFNCPIAVKLDRKNSKNMV